MSSPQEQFAELTRRTQENFKNLWQQWSERSTELMKGLSGRSQPTASAAGNPEEVPRVSQFPGAGRRSVGRGDTPVTGGSWILGCEEDSIGRSFTVVVRVIRRCLPAPPHRARWPVCLPCSARVSPLPPSGRSSGWLSV